MAKETQNKPNVSEFLKSTARHDEAVKQARTHKAEMSAFLPANVRGVCKLSSIQFGRNEKNQPYARINAVCVTPEQHAGERTGRRYLFVANENVTIQQIWERFIDDLQRFGLDSSELESATREQIVKTICPELVKQKPCAKFHTAASEGKDGREYVNTYFDAPADDQDDETEEEESEEQEEELTDEESESEETESDESTDEESDDEEETTDEETESEDEEEQEEEHAPPKAPKVGQTVKLTKHKNALGKVLSVDKAKQLCSVLLTKTKKKIVARWADLA